MKLNYNIPDLSELKPRSTFFLVNYIFRGAGPKHREAYALVMNFVRLVDLAISEYELARKAMLQFKETTESLALGQAIRASGHYEVCVSALKRAIDHLKAIRGHPMVPLVPQSLQDLLPRGINVLSGRVESQVTDLRNAIQHLEKVIKKGEILEGQAIALAVNEDDIELGSNKILHSDLAKWLQELHELSSKVAKYWEL